MWKYVKRYLPYAVLAAAFMVGEVLMDLLQPELMSRIADDGVLGVHTGGVGDMSLIWALGLKMTCLVLFGGLCGSLNNAFVHMTGQNVGNDIRKDAFRRLMTFSFPQMDCFGTGSLVTRMTNDITQVQNLVSQFVRGMIRTGMLMFGSIFFLFRLNTRFGLIALCAFPLIVGCMGLCLAKANPLFTRLQAQLDAINAILQEDISGIRVIKACIREGYEKLRFGKANGALVCTQLQVLTILTFMNPIINILIYVVVALILRVGTFEVAAGAATPGVIMAAITYTTQLLNGIMGLTMLSQNISRGFASWKRVKEVLHTEPQLQDGSFDGQTEQHGKIEFRNVSFSYPGSNRMVLKNINLTIRPGEMVAIMGATGCGKSALVNLIPRFYDAAEGTVLVDGVDVREYTLQALRNKVSIALQKAELFHTSPLPRTLRGAGKGPTARASVPPRRPRKQRSLSPAPQTAMQPPWRPAAAMRNCCRAVRCIGTFTIPRWERRSFMPEENKLMERNIPGMNSRERFVEAEHAQNAGATLRRLVSHFAREKALAGKAAGTRPFPTGTR